MILSNQTIIYITKISWCVFKILYHKCFPYSVNVDKMHHLKINKLHFKINNILESYFLKETLLI